MLNSLILTGNLCTILGRICIDWDDDDELSFYLKKVFKQIRFFFINCAGVKPL